jgi:ABC-type transporter Mla subunit MlaD
MSNKDLGQGNSSSTKRREGSSGWAAQNRVGVTSASSVIEDVSAKAKQVSSDAAETVTQQTKRFLDGQLGAGADLIGQAAGATRRVSEELKGQSPQFAALVRSVADRVDGYSDQLREQSVGELMRSATDFTRRQPALVFGLAAMAGFFAWRVVKAVPAGHSSVSSPPTQPTFQSRRGQPHGA